MKKVVLNDLFTSESIIQSYILVREQINISLYNLNGKFFNYVLCEDNEILYIGYSANIYLRLITHKLYKKEFNKILLIEFKDKISGRSKEKELIKHFRPKYNFQYLQ